ncbi:hypothetical protein GCM10012275_18540 [Longimycelium tulufanense]|uniref:Uncharacterized protein n=1 Tax=Longimycelium tulufanense TaxID=907463 RepID=A0A8J3CEB2_9PSEU|nr:hypothetical protein GCM10012275_18540 [Longimycelium tulufanense]
MLYVVGGGEIWLALSPEGAAEAEPRLSQYLRSGVTQNVTGADGTAMAVNFAHVVAAYITTEGVPKGTVGYNR